MFRKVFRFSKTELSRRKRNLLNLLNSRSTKKNCLVILPSNSIQYLSTNIPVRFRQNSNFFYFSSLVNYVDSILTIEHWDEKVSTKLFRSLPSDEEKQWSGDLYRIDDDIVERCHDIDEIHSLSSFGDYLEKRRKSQFDIIDDIGIRLNEFYDSSSSFTSPSALIHEMASQIYVNGIDENSLKMNRKLQKTIDQLRVIKSEEEQKLMEVTCHIGSKSMNKLIRKSKEMTKENSIVNELLLEQLFGMNCSEESPIAKPAYIPVVAGKDRGNIIHYINNDKILEDNDLVLMDAGCQLSMYCSDITRTWKLNDSFTQYEETIYQILVRIIGHLENRVESSISQLTLSRLHEIFNELLCQELTKEKVFKQNISTSKKKYLTRHICPHMIGHFLGIDVHDCSLLGYHSIALDDGICFTMEPGIYIPSSHQNDINDLSESIPYEFHGISIRLENDYLINKQKKLINLTKSCDL
ncbi:hypothetical protein SNEBB_007529 [Seison nebaliae]|nr:hypothetical protein SNEBB_007529 [Seison nebaliae]